MGKPAVYLSMAGKSSPPCGGVRGGLLESLNSVLVADNFDGVVLCFS